MHVYALAAVAGLQLTTGVVRAGTGMTMWPLLICILGNFCVLKSGQPMLFPAGGQVELLLCSLALEYGRRVARDRLLSEVWPDSDPRRASRSLNTLLSNLNKWLGDALGGQAAVLQTNGYYQLNVEAGVGVDVACFDALADAGDRELRRGAMDAATQSYGQAVELYRGDLCAGTDVQIVVERERLLARFLTLMARLAEYEYQRGDFAACLKYVQRVLGCEPCRESMHRLAMRCFVRQGERAQALHQYRLCEYILQSEFDATPEPATTALFDQIRLDPQSI